MIPAHFICWNHFYSFLSVSTRVQETRRSGPAGESPYSFSTEPLFLIPSRRDRRPGSQEIRLAGMHCTFFRGNQFSSFLPARTAALEARRSGSPGCTALFFQGNHFSSFPLFHGRRWPHQTFSSSSSSSSLPQRDSGILAIRKTGASVLRLVPPTS